MVGSNKTIARLTCRQLYPVVAALSLKRTFGGSAAFGGVGGTRTFAACRLEVRFPDVDVIREMRGPLAHLVPIDA
jgi:hypothetical protein